MAKQKAKSKTKPTKKAVKIKAAKPKKLSLRQQKFAQAVSSGLLPEAAAIRAGYTPNYARASSHKLMANVGILAYIQEVSKDEADKYGITRDKLTNIILEAINAAKMPSIITGQEDSKSQIAGAVALSRMYGLNAPEVKAEFKQTLLTIEFR